MVVRAPLTGDVVQKTMLLFFLIQAKIVNGSFVDVFCNWWSGGGVPSPHTQEALLHSTVADGHFRQGSQFFTSIFFFVIVLAVIGLVLVVVVWCWQLFPVVIRGCFTTGVVIGPQNVFVVYLLGLDNENEDVDNVIFRGGGYWRQAVAVFSSPREALSYSTVAL